MAGLDGALARPDVPVFLPVAEVRLDLHRPFPDAADSRRDVACWLGVGRGAAPRACSDTAGASPARLRGRMAADAERLAVRALRPEDAVLDRLVLACHRLNRETHRMLPAFAAVGQCKQDVGRSAA